MRHQRTDAKTCAAAIRGGRGGFGAATGASESRAGSTRRRAMMIELSQEDLAILKTLVKERINELGPEIRHTRTPDYHDDLKSLRATLRRLCENLEAKAAASASG
jgi:hypothetical protein